MKRSILRWVHLLFTIPVIGYAYSPLADLPNYAPIVRLIAIPVLILTGFWMYCGAIFGVIAGALWLGVCQLFGYGVAILSMIALLVARKIWFIVRARRSA
jgi:predicted tellurium resistance membrane protein TerC